MKQTATHVPSEALPFGIPTALQSDELRNVFANITHPDKAHVVRILTSIVFAPDTIDRSELSYGNRGFKLPVLDAVPIMGLGGFSDALNVVGRERAKALEKQRRRKLNEDELRALGAYSRFDLPPIDEHSLPITTHDIPIKDAVVHMVADMPFTTHRFADNGYLPWYVPFDLHYGHNPMLAMNIGGVLLARHVAGIGVEEFAKTVSKKIGDDTIPLKTVVDAMTILQAARIEGEIAGYDISRRDFGHLLLERGDYVGETVVKAADFFWPETQDFKYSDERPAKAELSEADLIRVVGSEYSLTTAIKNRHLFPPFTPENLLQIMQSIAPNANGKFYGGNTGLKPEAVVESFGLKNMQHVAKYTRSLLETGHNDVAYSYYRMCRGNIELPAMEILQRNVNLPSYDFVQAVVDKKLTDDHARLGITKTGHAGLEQLRGVMRNIEQFVLDPSKTADEIAAEIEQIRGVPFYERLWLSAVRFDETIWGQTSTEELLRVLRMAIEHRNNTELGTSQIDSAVYASQRNNDVLEARKDSRLSDEASQKVSELTVLFAVAWGNGSQEHDDGFRERVSETKGAVTARLRSISGVVSKGGTNAGNAALFAERDKLEELIRSGAFDTLTYSDFWDDAFEPFVEASFGHQVVAEAVLRNIPHDENSPIGRSWKNMKHERDPLSRATMLLELIEHDIILEFLKNKKNFDKKSLDFVTDTLFDIAPLREAIRSAVMDGPVGTSGKKRSINFTPTRDIGLELAGQIGDACYASRYRSISEQLPNGVAVMISENRGGAERLIGSSLFLEATTKDGDDVLIVRGLNPINNLIGAVDAFDFLKVYLDFAQETARRANRRLAIVKDHCGGASTNRPGLFAAISAYTQINELQKVDVPVDQVYFNGYDLEDSVYLV